QRSARLLLGQPVQAAVERGAMFVEEYLELCPEGFVGDALGRNRRWRGHPRSIPDRSWSRPGRYSHTGRRLSALDTVVGSLAVTATDRGVPDARTTAGCAHSGLGVAV